MSRFLSFFALLALSFTLGLGDADARRFGGGKSIGKQREHVTQEAPRTPASAAPAANSPRPGNRWLGPLAGLAAGGLLASLFMGGGFHGIQLFDILIIIAVIAAIVFLLRRFSRGAPQPAPMQYAGLRPAPEVTASPASGSIGGGAAHSGRPAWFDNETFVRSAKTSFLRLQAAYDAKDLNDIREYTTPEVFSEISMQIREMGDTKQVTDVVTLDAEVVDVATEGDLVIVSVRFSGLIRENVGENAQPFSELWHVQKNRSEPNANWYVAGIQQV